MSKADDVVALATAQEGKPYVFGAEGPATFDCSGLMQYVFGLVGIKLPRTSQEQQAATTAVTSPVPGDLVFYGRPATHVGLYIGNGKMINAPDVGKDVEVDNVGNPTNYGRVQGLGSITAPAVSALAGFVLPSLGTGEDWGSWAVRMLLTGSALVLAVALIGFGGYRAVASGHKTGDS